MASRSILGSLVQVARVQVTQGGADAFATTRLETGISTASRYGWLIDRVEFTTSGVYSYVATNDSFFRAQIVQGATPTASLNPTDVDFVCEHFESIAGIAAAVAPVVIPDQRIWMAPENYVIVDPSIHLTIDSTNVGTLTVDALIFYYPVELAELDLLRMIALR